MKSSCDIPSPKDSPPFSRVKVFLALAAVIVAGLAGTWGVLHHFSSGPIHNILLISIDTCRADHLSCYGDKRKITPNIDALANVGILFENVYTPVPLTLPAHSSMLTGTIPPYHGVHDNLEYKLAESNLTLAELLKQKGFTAGAIIGSTVIGSQTGMAQGFDAYDEQFDKEYRRESSVGERKGYEVNSHALKWLRENGRKRFFLFLHYYDPHRPYEAPEPFRSQFAGTSDTNIPDPDADNARADALYSAEIAHVDFCIGHIIKELKMLGLYDSTLIIITGDHGEMLGEHGEDGHGYFIYQSALKVPLIFKLPGRNRSKRITESVGLVDIMPTLCTLLDIDIPPQVQGTDLSALFTTRKPSGPPRYFYCESLTPTKYKAGSLLGVVHDRFKYIQTTRPELFDILDDPQESKNLADKESQRARVLQDHLKQILESQTRHSDPDSHLILDEHAKKQLESLGYVGGKVSEGGGFDQTQDDPKDVLEYHTLLLKAVGLQFAQKNTEAKALFQKLITLRPQVIEPYIALAGMANDQRYYSDAVRYLQEALAMAPQDHEVRSNLGKVLTNQGKFLVSQNKRKEAIANFRNALELDSTLSLARYGLLETLIQNQQLDQAAKQYVEFMEANPEEALPLASRACELTDFKNVFFLEALSAAYAKAGNFDQAIKIAEKTLEIVKAGNQQTSFHEIQKRIELYKSKQSSDETVRNMPK